MRDKQWSVKQGVLKILSWVCAGYREEIYSEVNLLCGLGRRRPSNPFPAPPSKPQDQNASGAATMEVGPYTKVDTHLRGLAHAAEGFGHSAKGGLDGEIYHVTSLADDGPGTLRNGCRSEQPLWIVFDVSGTITLSSYCRVRSWKTIDGRGQCIRITGKGLQLKDCEHVIICNLILDGGRGHDIDGIQMKPNVKHVWVDRCSISDFDDGCIDITRASTDITVSRCHFSNHDKTMLIGADPKHVDDRCIRVTIHHCFFDGTKQRHPRLRFGKVHLYNNYTRGWTVYAICASVEAQILSQCCIYEAGSKLKAFEYYPEKAGDTGYESAGSIRSEGDVFLKGAQGRVDNPDQVFQPQKFYSSWTLEGANDALMKKVKSIAGWQKILRPPDVTPAHSSS
ncbi:probable pectate lyase 4 isoform X1 [Physcomitrium patens]